MLPDAIRLPPMFTLPATPAPPTTTNAPVSTVVEGVLDLTTRLLLLLFPIFVLA